MSTILGIVNIASGSRNRGGVCLAVASYLILTSFLRRKGNGNLKVKATSVVIIAVGIVLSGVVVFWSYQYTASAGILGENAKDHLAKQSSGEYGLLLGGRRELLGSLPAIYDSPILGHGSWAKDPSYVIIEFEALAALGYENATDGEDQLYDEGYIPTHSFILGAWVEAGIVGALFWGWVFVLTARSLTHLFPSHLVLLPIGAFCAFSLLWDILFSFYGGQMCFIETFYIVMVMTCFGGCSRVLQQKDISSH
jgi:O-antigen ligase